MPIIYHNKTDLFQFIVDNNMSFSHGVNCSDSFGSGVAGLVARYFPHVKKLYHHQCKSGFKPGSCQAIQISDDDGERYCYNIGTQIEPGPDARKTLITQGFINLFESLFENEGVYPSVAIPKIGCGIGGLDWDDDVEPILDFLVRRVYDNEVTVHVCSLE